jgi:hypothetical protein
VVENDPIAAWPSTLMYLILVDQVGKVIRPASSAPRDKSDDLRIALGEFDSALDEIDRDMMYALRCAFGHEFAMANPGPYPDGAVGPLRHRFQLVESTEQKLVVYHGQWNGKYGSACVGGPTEVNLTELANVVERVVSDIEQRVDAGDVRLIDGVTPEMVLHRWGFRVLNAVS